MNERKTLLTSDSPLCPVPVTQQEYDFTVQNGVNAILERAKDLSRIHIFDGMPKFKL